VSRAPVGAAALLLLDHMLDELRAGLIVNFPPRRSSRLG
jgi:hypothetical protein